VHRVRAARGLRRVEREARGTAGAAYLSVPFSSTSPVALPRPEMVPPTVSGLSVHATAMFVTACAATVPVPLVTSQFRPVGCVDTVTA